MCCFQIAKITIEIKRYIDFLLMKRCQMMKAKEKRRWGIFIDLGLERDNFLRQEHYGGNWKTDQGKEPEILRMIKVFLRGKFFSPIKQCRHTTQYNSFPNWFAACLEPITAFEIWYSFDRTLWAVKWQRAHRWHRKNWNWIGLTLKVVWSVDRLARTFEVWEWRGWKGLRGWKAA